MNKKISTAVALVASSTILLTATACAAPDPSGSTTDGDGESHTILLDWLPNPDHAGIYMAKDDGAFKDKGLSVKIQAPSGTADAAKMISTGQVDLAISYEPDTIMAASQGMKVKAVASLIPEVLSSLIIKGNDKTIADIKGTTVGNPSLATSVPTLNYILKQNGMSESDVTNVSLSTGLVEPLLNDKVSAVFGAYKNIEGVQLSEEGNYTVLPFDQIGVPSFDELVLIANPDRLKNDKEYANFVTNALQALKTGFSDAQADPNKAYTAIKSVTQGYDDETLKAMVEATVPAYHNSKGFGTMNANSWDSYAAWMYDNGLIDKAIEGRSVMTNDYLD